MKQRIVIFSSDFPPVNWAGKNRTAYNHARYFADRKDCAMSIVSTKQRDSVIKRELFINVKRTEVNLEDELHDPLYLLSSPPQERAIIDDIVSYKPNVVILHDLLNVPASIISHLKQRGIKTVIHLGNLYPFCLKLHTFRYPPCKVGLCRGLDTMQECVGCYKDFFYRGFELGTSEKKELQQFIALRRAYLSTLYQLADLLISPSQYLARIYEKHLQRSVCVIPNGIKMHPPVPHKKNKKIVFGYIGSLDLNKGLPILAEAFSLISSRHAELHVYGPRDEIIGLPIVKERYKRIIFKGPFEQKDIPRIYSEIDCAVVPSYFENHPTIILEALSQKIPVIASRTGGIPEMVYDGINALLFTPGNVSELKMKMMYFVTNPAKLQEYAKHMPRVRTVEEMGDETHAAINTIPPRRIDRNSIKTLATIESKLYGLKRLQVSNYYALKGLYRRNDIKKFFTILGNRTAHPFSAAENLLIQGLCQRGKRNTVQRKIIKQKQKAPHVNAIINRALLLSNCNYKRKSNVLMNTVAHYRARIQHLFKFNPMLLTYRIASVYKQIGNTTQANALFDNIIKNTTDASVRAGAFFHKGEMAYQAHRLRQAKKYFTYSVRCNHGHGSAKRYLKKIAGQRA